MIRFDFSKSQVAESDLSSIADEVERATGKLAEERKTKQIGFWDLPFEEGGLIQIRNVAKDVRSRFRNLIVLGIGGSSTGLKALSRALWPNDNPLRLFVQESPDPASVAKLLRAVDLSQTCINVISKSGKTVETCTLFDVFKKALQEKTGKQWRDHVVVTTEENDGDLYRLVKMEKLIHFPVPKNVGGRFSVFSSVGLFPLTCIGVDTQKLLKGAAASEKLQDAACRNGAIHYLLQRDYGKNISVMMPYGDALREFGGWYAQLWAESLGKEGRGQTPLAALGPQDQHSLAQLFLDGPKDKTVTIIKVETKSKDPLADLMKREADAVVAALVDRGVPVVEVLLPAINEETMGQLLMSYQIQTAFTGHLMGLNPYDQPAVEEIKKRI